MNQPKLCERCKKRPSVVGLDATPVWLCMECFDDALAARVRAAKAGRAKG